MYQAYPVNNNIVRKLIKSGKLGVHYNNTKFFKKYEVGYWDTILDLNVATQTPISGPYQVFRPIYSSSKIEKVQRKFEKMVG